MSNMEFFGGILSGLSIKRAVESGEIIIDPWVPSHINPDDRVNPASYDLTLGEWVAVYDGVVRADFECGSNGAETDHMGASRPGVPGERMALSGCYSGTPYSGPCLDAAKRNEVVRYKMDGRGFLLKPSILYLMHTAERIRTDKYVPIVDGKSSIGRLGVAIHQTAGFGDPGFDGQYTLEVVTVHPVIVYPGMRFCQMRFHTLVGGVESYSRKGSYRGSLAEGPVPSQSWKMFLNPGKPEP